MRNTVEAELNGVNDLVNHDVGEVKLFVLFDIVDILGKHGNAFAVAGRAVTVTPIDLLIVVKGANPGLLAKSPVAQGAGAVVFTAEPERLEQKHDGHLNDGNKEQEHLESGLMREERLIDGTRAQEHEDKHVEQTRGALSTILPVHGPLVENGNDEVAEDRLEEQHAGNEVTPDVDFGFEVPCVDVLEAESIGHLISCVSIPLCNE